MFSQALVGSVLWSVVSLVSIVGLVVATVGLLVSDRLGDRFQSLLLSVAFLLVAVVWLVSSAVWVTANPAGWWWAGVTISAGAVAIAFVFLLRVIRRARE